MQRDYSVSATLLGAALSDLALLAQDLQLDELTEVVQMLHRAADLHWSTRPEQARDAWVVATARLQTLLEENPELRSRVMATALLEEPVEPQPRQRSTRSWSTKPRRHLPRIGGLGRDGGRAYDH